MLLFEGCSTSPMSGIDANCAQYGSWPVDMQSAVLEGNAVKDMTPERVRMAFGEPARIEPRVGSTTSEEDWFYEKAVARMCRGLTSRSVAAWVALVCQLAAAVAAVRVRRATIKPMKSSFKTAW